MIVKENNDSIKAKILNIDALLDIQWWLYKSVLSRKPLDTKYYRDWYNLYKKSYDLSNKIESDEIAYFEAAKDYKIIISRLRDAKSSLRDKISSEDKESLHIIIDKIIDGTDKMVKILEGEE